MTNQVKAAVIGAIAVVLAAFIAVLWSSKDTISPTEPPIVVQDTPTATAFLSPNKLYEATRVGSGNDIHYQLIERETNRKLLVTHAEYTTPNDVKAGVFSQDSTRFAAAYHYGHAGGYTWIGVWDIQTGALIRVEKRPGWTVDIFAIFENKT